MARVPSAVWIVDTKKEHLAVDEARKLGLPVIAILDTNCDPDEVDYKIPGNDDAIRSVTLLTRVIADAVADGLIARAGARTGEDDVAGDEPLAEWERELLGGEAAEVVEAAEAPAAEVVEAAEAPAAEVVEAAEAPAAEAVEAAEAPAEVAAEAPAAEVVEAAEAPAAEVVEVVEVAETPAPEAEAPVEAPAPEA